MKIISPSSVLLLLLSFCFTVEASERIITAAEQILTGDLKDPDNQRIHLTEEHRLQEYYKRNYTWPLQEFKPNTEGWRKLMTDRLEQIQELPKSQRYEGYLQTLRSAQLVPNFTEHGFGLARCPDELLGALRQGIRDGLATAGEEPRVNVIESPLAPWFIKREDLTQRVLNELQHYPETWAGIELTPYRAYGFRLYRNESELFMHVDKSQTHIISFILHIDSSEDAKPWPILIEDFHGNTHEVTLTPGDILFYESSKCFHGRPHTFNGSWYSSLFVHYYPKYGWFERNHALEGHYAVPPVWSGPENEVRHHRGLEMVGTSMREPECPNKWCRTKNTIKWSGPGEEGFWIDPTGAKHPFHPKKVTDDGISPIVAEAIKGHDEL